MIAKDFSGSFHQTQPHWNLKSFSMATVHFSHIWVARTEAAANWVPKYIHAILQDAWANQA